MAKQKLSKDQISKIKNNLKGHADEIVTIYSLRDRIRQTVGMYIGAIGNRGMLTLIRETIQNSFDEIQKGKVLDRNVYVFYDESNHKFCCQDSGRGIPFDNIIRIYTEDHTSSNYNKSSVMNVAGMNGIGIKAVNALSSDFIVESHILGKARKVVFKDMISEKGEEEVPIEEGDFLQGTRVTFKPCYSSLGEITLKIEDVLTLFKRLLPLTPIGTTIIFTGKKLNGDICTDNLVNEKGLMTFVEAMTKSPLINNPIYIKNQNNNNGIEVFFTYDSDDLQNEQIIASANGCATNNLSTHVTGFLDGMCRFFRDYMNKIYLSSSNSKKKNKLNIINSDIKTGLKAAINAASKNPIFTGQAKENLSNEDMYYFARDSVRNGLGEWAKSNPKDLQLICNFLKGIAEIRVKSEAGKTKLSNNYKASVTGYPRKFEPPTEEWDEIAIVEGDSAGGQAKSCRKHETQGIMELRGKIPNAFTTAPEKFINNEEISGMIVIFSKGDEKNYGKRFDINKVPWKKIILMPDADPDGAHIRSLLIRFIMAYMPDLITYGKVYAAVPPLFGINIGKNKYKYFIDRIDYVRYLQTKFSKNNKVEDIKKNIIPDDEITKIIYNNEDYTYDLDIIANRYAINSNLLELLLIHRNEPLDELQKTLNKYYRFIEINNVKNTSIIRGLVGDKIQLIFLNEKLYNDTQYLYDKYIKECDNLYLRLNGEIKSLYSFMKTFESYSPKELIRYKGLGEMNSSQLGESTLHPDSKYRTLIQYTWESAKDEIEKARFLNSNKDKFIKNVAVSRIDLIG